MTMPPSEWPQAIVRVGVPTGAVECVERRDLVGDRLLDRPAGRRVGRAGERVAVAEQPRPVSGSPTSRAGFAAARCHVAVAVEKERPVPVGRDVDPVRRPVGERPGQGRDRSAGRSTSGAEHHQHRRGHEHHNPDSPRQRASVSSARRTSGSCYPGESQVKHRMAPRSRHDSAFGGRRMHSDARWRCSGGTPVGFSAQEPIHSFVFQSTLRRCRLRA